jgi:hypothetical protein
VAQLLSRNALMFERNWGAVDDSCTRNDQIHAHPNGGRWIARQWAGLTICLASL